MIYVCCCSCDQDPCSDHRLTLTRRKDTPGLVPLSYQPYFQRKKFPHHKFCLLICGIDTEARKKFQSVCWSYSPKRWPRRVLIKVFWCEPVIYRIESRRHLLCILIIQIFNIVKIYAYTYYIILLKLHKRRNKQARKITWKENAKRKMFKRMFIEMRTSYTTFNISENYYNKNSKNQYEN